MPCLEAVVGTQSTAKVVVRAILLPDLQVLAGILLACPEQAAVLHSPVFG